MKIQFGGDFTVQRSLEDVYAFLIDPEKFCPLLPDYQSMQKIDDKTFNVSLRVGISHIRGTATVKMQLIEQSASTHALYEGKGDVPGGTTTLRAGFDLSPADGANGPVGAGTKVTWKGEGQIAGRLPSIAGGLLEPLAKKNVQKLIDTLQGALSAQDA